MVHYWFSKYHLQDEVYSTLNYYHKKKRRNIEWEMFPLSNYNLFYVLKFHEPLLITKIFIFKIFIFIKCHFIPDYS